MKTFTITVYTRNRKYNYATSNDFDTIVEYMKNAILENPKSRILIEL